MFDKLKKKKIKNLEEKKINNFLKKIENSLDGNILFEVHSPPCFKDFRINASSLFLQESNRVLYPTTDFYFSFFKIKKENKKYQISQTYKIGSMLCEKEYFEIDDPDICKENVMEKARELANLLIWDNFKEIDERKIKTKGNYDMPNLIHHFGLQGFMNHDSKVNEESKINIRQDSKVYTGSEINLEKEIIKNLDLIEESSIKTNLQVYYAFF